MQLKHVRQVKSIVDWITMIGGVLGIFIAVFGILIGGYNTFLQNIEFQSTLEADLSNKKTGDGQEGK